MKFGPWQCKVERAIPRGHGDSLKYEHPTRGGGGETHELYIIIKNMHCLGLRRQLG